MTEHAAGLAGWGALYAKNADFRAAFDDMHAAVERLPPDLIERGRALGFPQLHRACVEGDLPLVTALLEAGAVADTYPCTQNDDDLPPLVWLAEEPDLTSTIKIQVAAVLLLAGADVDEGEALQIAEENGDDDFAAFLRQSGASEVFS
jgi:hypothetical protein